MAERYDFCGYATKNDLLCTDGRTIRKDAFKGCDGITVPLVWNHRHDDPDMVIGHALLENRNDGVYMYGKFNDTEKGRTCKKILDNKDVKGLSIWANQLKQRAGDVLHGVIQEVSLVLAGANPGALIDFALSHADGSDGEVYAYLVGDEYTQLRHGDIEFEDKNKEKEEPVMEELYHADADKEPTGAENKKSLGEIFKAFTEEQKNAVYAMLAAVLQDQKNKNSKKAESAEDEDEDELQHAANEEDEEDEEDDDEKESEGGSVRAIFNTLSKKQKDAVYALIAAIVDNEKKKLKGSSTDDEDDEDDEDEEETKPMKHNAFEGARENNYLSHADFDEIMADAKKLGSLRDAVKEYEENGILAHASTEDDWGVSRGNGNATHFVRDPEMLFPDYKAINEVPDWIKRDTGWVTEFMSNAKHIPFSRIKTLHADITADEARAQGYIKGNLKKDEFFTLIKRTTDPQTIYKKQAIDRDDQIDITGFDVVAWIRGEMRIMLEEELARAAFIGDGRLSSSQDKISESHIRPIAKDSDLYAVKVPVAVESGGNLAVSFIESAIRGRKSYKGSGNPVLYTTEDMLTEMLLIKDALGHYMYPNMEALATALRVRKIVPVPVFEGVEIPITTTVGTTSTTTNQDLYGIIVNLQDYAIGADKGGAISIFDDFDIDYNQNKYLIETRVSGALIKPYSALVLHEAVGA